MIRALKTLEMVGSTKDWLDWIEERLNRVKNVICSNDGLFDSVSQSMEDISGGWRENQHSIDAQRRHNHWLSKPLISRRPE